MVALKSCREGLNGGSVDCKRHLFLNYSIGVEQLSGEPTAAPAFLFAAPRTTNVALMFRLHASKPAPQARLVKSRLPLVDVHVKTAPAVASS